MSRLWKSLVERIRHKKQKGFTLLEVMLITSMMMTCLATVTVGIKAGHEASEETRRRSVLTAMSGDIMDRLFQIDFGTAADPEPTAEELTELFDDDDVLGPATFCSLRVTPGEDGHMFQLGNFPYDGVWEVRINNDLNSDGDTGDDREGRDDIYRVNIIYDGVLVLETMRSAPVS